MTVYQVIRQEYDFKDEKWGKKEAVWSTTSLRGALVEVGVKNKLDDGCHKFFIENLIVENKEEEIK